MKSPQRQAADAYDKVANLQASEPIMVAKAEDKARAALQAKIRKIEAELPPEVRAIYEQMGSRQ